jgi:AraC-like DNA-binding protein
LRLSTKELCLVAATRAFQRDRLRDLHGAGARIADIAYEAGFSDLSHFNRSFRRHFGLTPSELRAQAHASARRGP